MELWTVDDWSVRHSGVCPLHSFSFAVCETLVRMFSSSSSSFSHIFFYGCLSPSVSLSSRIATEEKRNLLSVPPFPLYVPTFPLAARVTFSLKRARLEIVPRRGREKDFELHSLFALNMFYRGEEKCFVVGRRYFLRRKIGHGFPCGIFAVSDKYRGSWTYFWCSYHDA